MTNQTLYSAIGKTYNTGVENDDEFRIPDYNISGRFLQPGTNIGTQVSAGLPQHTHSGTSSSNGAHTHTRGSMNIVGEFYVSDLGNSGIAGSWSSGAFSLTQSYERGNNGQTLAGKGTKISFDASKSWSGNTSSAGGHTHTITVGNASDSSYGKSSTVQPPSQIVRLCIKYK